MKGLTPPGATHHPDMTSKGQISGRPGLSRPREPRAQQSQHRSPSTSPNTEPISTPGTGASTTRDSQRSQSPVPRLDLPTNSTETRGSATRTTIMDAQVLGLTNQLASAKISTAQQQPSQRAGGGAVSPNPNNSKPKSVLEGVNWTDIGDAWVDGEVVGYFETIRQLERLQADMELRQREHGGLEGELAALKVGIRDLLTSLKKKKNAWIKARQTSTPGARGRTPPPSKAVRLEQPAWKY